jgi:hypothetical protein
MIPVGQQKLSLVTVDNVLYLAVHVVDDAIKLLVDVLHALEGARLFDRLLGGDEQVLAAPRRGADLGLAQVWPGDVQGWWSVMLTHL